MLNLLKNIFSKFRQQNEQVLPFTDLMISVDEANTVEELEEIVAYYKKHQVEYKRHEQEFAKEHLLKRISEIKEKLLDNVARIKAN